MPSFNARPMDQSSPIMDRIAARSVPLAAKSSKGHVGDLNDVIRNERRAFRRALLRMLQAAFPLQHRPAVVAVLCKLGENADEVHLAIAQRPEASRRVRSSL